MTNLIGRRELLAGLGLCAVGAGAGLGQTVPNRDAGTDASGRRIGGAGRGGGRGGGREIPTRKAKTTKLFLTPPGWPNAIDIDHDQQRGFWVQEQKHVDEPEAAWLIDWNGKLLHTVKTKCANTSGMCYGGGYVWSGANGGSVINHPTPAVYGIFQTDMDGKQISHRQIPFGPKNNGGATHGMSWQQDVGKIWIFANRLGANIRIDPKTWEVDYLVRTATPPGGWGRMHGIKYDNGSIWQVIGKQAPGTTGYDGYTPGLMRTDIETGQIAEIVEFVPGSCDMHDLAINKGVFYGVDAGEHPGWSIDVPQFQRPGFPPLNSPSGGYVFRIDMI